ncbi:MAG TPA: hypothetical protein VMO47_04805, partial [Rhodothermales bacterium]|nr:hypothetical protein [Rhodothermales bacterium]
MLKPIANRRNQTRREYLDLNHRFSIAQRANCPVEAAALLFFDMETTSLCPGRGARITEIAVLDTAKVQLEWKDEVNSTDRVPSRLLSTLLDELSSGVVVGHNVLFDLRFLACEAERLLFAGP